MRSFLTVKLKVFNLRQNFNKINSRSDILHSCNMSGTPINLRDVLKKKKKTQKLAIC